MVVIIATVVTMVSIVAMVIGAVVVAAGPTIAVIADETTAEGNNGRQKHGDEKQTFHG